MRDIAHQICEFLRSDPLVAIQIAECDLIWLDRVCDGMVLIDYFISLVFVLIIDQVTK
jgi:hypothetical protein